MHGIHFHKGRQSQLLEIGIGSVLENTAVSKTSIVSVFASNGAMGNLFGKRSIASTFYPLLSSAIIVSDYTQSKKFSA